MVQRIATHVRQRVRRGRWLMGALVLLPAIFFPPRDFHYRLDVEYLNMTGSFPYLASYGRLGGLAGQLVNYIRLLRFDPAQARDFLVVLVPFCLVTVVLACCVMLFWGLLVDRAARVTQLRAFLAVLAALLISLALTLCLFPVELVLLARGEGPGFTLLSVSAAVIAAQILFAPFLFLSGAVLAHFQARTDNQNNY